MERQCVPDVESGSEYIDYLDGLFDDAVSLDQGGLVPAQFGVDDVRYFFRGQANGAFGINSSLYRALKGGIPADASPRSIEDSMKEAEGRIIRAARQQGIGRNLTALELLTVLQHHLVPTRLIDVSASWKVALYFAAEGSDHMDGRIFVIATKPSLWEEFSRSNGQVMKWPSTKEHPWQRTTWPIVLPFTDPRMISQQGYFLVGGLATNVGGHHQYWRDTTKHPPAGNMRKAPLTQRELREVSTLTVKFPILRGLQGGPLVELEKKLSGSWTAVGLTIPVPGEFKAQVRERLEVDFGINRDSIYPPIDESLRLLKFVAEGRELGGY